MKHPKHTVTDLVIQGQLLLNAGLAWKVEGQLGRECVDLINMGAVMLAPHRCIDAYGNTVPSREDVQPGMRGSRQFVVSRFGEDHANELELLPSEPDSTILSISLF